MLCIPRDTVAEMGGEQAVQDRVAAYTVAVMRHPFTVDEPAPVEADVIEAIHRAGGWGAVQVVDVTEGTNGLPLDAPLEVLRAAALVRIDQLAEAERLAYITPGAGQAMEYRATEDEARRWQPGQELDFEFPFLAAEADAIEAATGTRPAAADVVQQVMGMSVAWAGIGAAIKRLRRTRKMQVETAKTAEAIEAILAQGWTRGVQSAPVVIVNGYLAGGRDTEAGTGPAPPATGTADGEGEIVQPSGPLPGQPAAGEAPT